MEFKEKLKKLRNDNNLSQKELADAIFVSRSAIAKWENGNGVPSDDNLKEIIKYFNLPSDYFNESKFDINLYRKLVRRRQIIIKSIKIGVVALLVITALLLIEILAPSIGSEFVVDGYRYRITDTKYLFSKGEVKLIETEDESDELIIPDTVTKCFGIFPDTFKVKYVSPAVLVGKSVKLPRYFEGYHKNTKISDYYLRESFIKNISVSEENEYYDSREDCGCIIDSKTNMLLYASENYFLPKSVVGVASFAFLAFMYNNGTKFILPDNIEILDDWAFGHYPGGINLEDNLMIDYYDFSKVKEIGSGVINGIKVRNNSTIILPRTIEKMDYTAFGIHIDNKNVNFYYKGSLSDWNNIQLKVRHGDLKNMSDANEDDLYFLEGNNLYFYSEIEPVEKGKYWHFDNNNQPIVWN